MNFFLGGGVRMTKFEVGGRREHFYYPKNRQTTKGGGEGKTSLILLCPFLPCATPFCETLAPPPIVSLYPMEYS